jgi:hypothetical protein
MAGWLGEPAEVYQLPASLDRKERHDLPDGDVGVSVRAVVFAEGHRRRMPRRTTGWGEPMRGLRRVHAVADRSGESSAIARSGISMLLLHRR